MARKIPKLRIKPKVAFRDGDRVVFVSWDKDFVEFAVWNEIDNYPTDIYQHPIYKLK